MCNLRIEFPPPNLGVDADNCIWVAGHGRHIHHLDEEAASRSSTVGGPLHHVRTVLVGKKCSSCVGANDEARVGEVRHYSTVLEKQTFR